MQLPGILMVISGPSGVGKGTLCKSLLTEFKDLHYSISYTTRPPRPGEQNGREYYFIDKEVFLEKIEKTEFIEWAKVYDNYYGTSKREVEKVLKSGSNIILEIDTQGAMQVKDNYPEGVFIFIIPPGKKELEKRIWQRGTESQEKAKKRLNNVNKELEYIYSYDYVVVNDSLPDALKKLKAIYIAEKCRPHRLKEKWEGDLL